MLVGVEESSVSSSRGCDKTRLLKDGLWMTIFIDDHLFMKCSLLRDSSIACCMPQRKWSSGTLNSTCLKAYQSIKLFFLYFLSFVARGTTIHLVFKTRNLGVIPDSSSSSYEFVIPTPKSVFHMVQQQPLNCSPLCQTSISFHFPGCQHLSF